MECKSLAKYTPEHTCAVHVQREVNVLQPEAHVARIARECAAEEHVHALHAARVRVAAERAQTEARHAQPPQPLEALLKLQIAQEVDALLALPLHAVLE